MSYLPWRKAGSWACLACGECCRKFVVVLTPYEYARLTNFFGLGVVDIDKHGDPCLRQVSDTCLFQSEEGLCKLQPLGLKPLACKVWPFKVKKVSEGRGVSYEELFTYRGEAYRVLIHSGCSGVGKGTWEGMVEAIKEVIEIKRNPETPQRFTTANLEAQLKQRQYLQRIANLLSLRGCLLNFPGTTC
ncbi:MAG: YkgJ family cysteine cluster protein [Candidatus Nezhaarchaeota archaeon]|nr:YkgJ family cysteine cluster protein [Candidatus Nezhaarchaeota archaeon]